MTLPKSLATEGTAMDNRASFERPPGHVTDPVDLQRWHDFRVAYHRAQALDGPTGFPLQVDVELNSQCNLRCAFCVHGQGKVAYRALDRALYEQLVDEGQDHGLVSMKFNYINEPLMVHDLPEHIRYAVDHGVLNTYFATNGVLLNERMREELIDAKTSKVMVSIDAATPGTYERMRRSKHYNRVVSNIHALLDLRAKRGTTWPLVRVNFLKTTENIDEAEAFIQMWHGTADVVGYQSQVGLPGVEGGTMRDDFASFRCSFPSKQLVVDAAGHILPCCTFSGREMPLGHIADMTLREAWTSEQMGALRRSHHDDTWRDNPVCYQCIYGDAPVDAVETDASFVVAPLRSTGEESARGG